MSKNETLPDFGFMALNNCKIISEQIVHFCLPPWSFKAEFGTKWRHLQILDENEDNCSHFCVSLSMN